MRERGVAACPQSFGRDRTCPPPLLGLGALGGVNDLTLRLCTEWQGGRVNFLISHRLPRLRIHLHTARRHVGSLSHATGPSYPAGLDDRETRDCLLSVRQPDWRSVITTTPSSSMCGILADVQWKGGINSPRLTEKSTLACLLLTRLGSLIMIRNISHAGPRSCSLTRERNAGCTAS